MGRFRCFPPHLLQPEEARKAVNPYEQEILYMGAKEYAFAQADEDPFQAALDWLLARDWIMLPRATAEQMAAKVAERVEHVRLKSGLSYLDGDRCL